MNTHHAHPSPDTSAAIALQAAAVARRAARHQAIDLRQETLLAALPAATAPVFIGDGAGPALATYRQHHPGAAGAAYAWDEAVDATASDLVLLMARAEGAGVTVPTLLHLAATVPAGVPLFIVATQAPASLDALCTVLMDTGWMPDLVSDGASDTAAGFMMQAHRRFDGPLPDALPASLFTVVVPSSSARRAHVAAARSAGLAEVDAAIISVADARSAASAWAAAAASVRTPWVLLCQPDAHFPAGFGRRLNALLAEVPDEERPRSLIGFIGMGVDAQQQGFAPAGFVVEGHHSEDHPASAAAVSIDELAIVLARDSLHHIDPAFGWHLWATDLCLAAICDHQVFPRIATLPLMHLPGDDTDAPLPQAFYDSAARLLAKFPAFGPVPTLNGNIDAAMLARRAAAQAPAPLAPERLENGNFLMLDQLDADVGRCLEQGAGNEALARIVAGVNANFIKPAFRNRGLYIPQFDRRLEQLAGMLECSEPSPADVRTDGGTLLIATELYDVGGHSRSLLDVSHEVDRPLVVLTDLFNTYAKDPARARAVTERFAHADVIVLPPASFWEKSAMVRRAVAALRPGAIMYFSHHQDPVPFVGTLGAAAPRKIFFHHADHNPSLGCTLAGMRHVDFSDTLREVCERQLAQPCPVLPMHVPDEGRKLFPGTIALADFSVVTSGRAAKFRREGVNSLQDIARASLETIGGRFFHIGPLDEAWILGIRRHLAGAGIAPERFVHLGTVPSVWQTLKTLDAACYLGSAPEGGGRAAIEAQGCGYPLVYYRGHEAGSLMANYSLYADERSSWSTLSELRSCLLEVVVNHAALAERARRLYDDTCSRPVFRRAIDQLLAD